jgi:subtilisin family serine protease
METYIVLRDLQRRPVGDPFGTGTRDLAPPQPKIHTERTDEKGRAALLREPDVVAVCRRMPTKLVGPIAEPDSALATGTAWGVAAVGADTSPDTGEGVTVAVLDTGIDAGHDAFDGMDVVQEDFSGDGVGDIQGHGTHCAGTICGQDVDGTRIGIARGVSKLLSGKVLGDDGGGSSEMLFDGITWALDQSADVISMSLGFDFPGLVKQLIDQGWPPELATSAALESYRGNLRMFDALMAVVRAGEAFDSGCVVVAAAGNESRRDENPDFEIAVSLPAAADGVVSVGALGQDGGTLDIAPFSNTFPVISAPGVQITSAKIGGGLSVKSGTSMACPHVAGVTALWWQSVREGGIPPHAATVVAKVTANARTPQTAASAWRPRRRPEAQSSRRSNRSIRPSSNDAGRVERTKSRSTSTKRSGSSLNGKCPAPGKISRRLSGMSSCASRPCASGMMRSRSPHTISDGTSRER